MNIVIYGTGGVGGYFGTRLVQSGNNVTFIARGKHLAAIKENGLQLKSIKGDCLVKPTNVTENIKEVKEIDLVLICVKTWQLSEVAEKIKPVLGANTMVISLLNGAENAAILCRIIPKKHVLGGLCKVISKIEDYGVINHISYEPTIIFGELKNNISERALLFEKVFVNAGIKTELSKNIEIDIWTKFLFITTISAIGALTRATLGEMIAIPELKKIMRKTAEEIATIAKAKGSNLPEDTIESQFKIIESQPYNATSSLQRDVLNGKPSELEAQNGTVVRMGKELGIPTPVNDFIYYSLLPQENRARKLS